MLDHNDHVVAFVDDFLHEALESADAAYVERHCDSCRICKLALDDARKRFAALETLPAIEPSERLIQATLGRIDAHERRTRKVRRWFLGVSLPAIAASALIIGFLHLYYINLTPTPYDLRILGQNRLMAGSMASIRIRLLDRSNGQPMQGVPVDVELRRTGQEVKLASFTTNAEGTGEPRFQLPDWADGDYTLHVVARPGKDVEEISETVQLRRSWKLMLSSDKPVYQPGQTILIRSLALYRADLKPVSGQEVTFAISDPKGNVIFKKQDVTSKYGIASAACPLASEILEGRYDIDCKIGDTSSRRSVEVKKYVLPKFKVEVTLDQPYYQPGQKVKGTVRADYFFGKPVAEGMVEIEATLLGHGLQTMPQQGKTLAKFDRKTDKDGKAEFEFTLPKSLIGREQDSADARFSLSATVTDSAGQTYTRTVSRVVTAQPLRVEIIPENGQLVPGVANKVYLFVSYADGRPAKARMTVAVMDKHLRFENLRFEIAVTSNSLGVASFEIPAEILVFPLHLWVRGRDDNDNVGGRTIEQTVGVSEDFLIRTDKAVYTGGETMTLTALGGGREPVFVDLIKDGQTILTETLEPAANGTASHAIDLPPDLAGTIELCAYRFGPSGLPVRKTRVLYIRSADQLDIKAEMDRREYRPGGKATLRLTLSDDKGQGVPGALSLSAVDEAVFSVLDQMPGMERTFYLLEQELLKPVYAIYPWAPDLKTSIPQEDRNQFEQALFARTARTDTSSATQESSRGGRTGERTLGNRRSIHSLAGESFPAKVKQVEKTRENGLHAMNIMWAAIALAALLLSYAGLWLFLSEKAVYTVHWAGGCIAMVTLVGYFLVYSIGTRSTTTFQYVGSKVSTTRGGGGTPSPGAKNMMTKTGASPRKGSEPPVAEAPIPKAVSIADPIISVEEPTPVRVRELFPETLLWRPELITDDSGRASLDIELADSITTWRLSASAVTADGRLGAAQSSIRVFQPFFVDLNLPVSLTRGDEVAVPVVVYNYLVKPQTVELKLEKGDWFELLGDATQRIELEANAIRATSFRIRVRKVGEQTLQVTAAGSGVADAIKKNIEVVPDGRRVETVINGTLDNPARQRFTVPPEAIEGSPKMILKIYPSTFSHIVEGLDGIFQMPYGCFEQTSSTTYPNLLALDYLKRTKKNAPEIEAKARQYIHLGYQRLIGFEVPGGGFDWFGRPPANVTLTAYGLMEFEDMAKVHDVDPNLLSRTRAWLMSKRNSDGSWSPESHALHEDPTRGRGDLARLSTTAYVAWAIYHPAGMHGYPKPREISQPTLDYLLSFRPEKIDDAYVLALVCNALLAIDPSGKEAQLYLHRLDAMKQSADGGKKVFWQQKAGARTTFYGGGQSGAVETTSLAALALMTAKQSPATTRAALNWIVAQKDGNGTWHSTQATVLALKALVAATESPLGGDQERRIEIALGPQFKKEIVIPPNQADVMKQLDLSPFLTPGAQELTITERSETGAGYQAAFRYHVPGATAEKAEPLTIDLAYDRAELDVGGTVKATATVTNRMRTAAPMVIVDLPIPGGFAIESEDLAALVKAGKIAKYQVTARQAIVYLRGLEPSKPLKLQYRLKAMMPVKVTVAPARVYEYYDTDKQGRSAGARLTAK
jgi:uncharacterized protein YfaS (alpha-2-macroglobulin family)